MSAFEPVPLTVPVAYHLETLERHLRAVARNDRIPLPQAWETVVAVHEAGCGFFREALKVGALDAYAAMCDAASVAVNALLSRQRADLGTLN